MATILKRPINAPNSDKKIGAVRLWTGRCRQLVEGKLRHQWSPEQIADWLGRSEGISLSHERIYQYIRTERAAGGTLHTQLRQQLRPKRVTSKMAYKGSIPNRISIDARPSIVGREEAHRRLGSRFDDVQPRRWCALDFSRTKKSIHAHCAG
jgi:IS30 family transposase